MQKSQEKLNKENSLNKKVQFKKWKETISIRKRNNVTNKENYFKIKKQHNKLAAKLFQKTPISLYNKEALLRKMMCGIMEWYYLH